MINESCTGLHGAAIYTVRSIFAQLLSCVSCHLLEEEFGWCDECQSHTFIGHK